MARKKLKTDEPDVQQIELSEQNMATMNDDGDIQLVDDIDMFSLHEDQNNPFNAADKEDGTDKDAEDDDLESSRAGLENSQRILL